MFLNALHLLMAGLAAFTALADEKGKTGAVSEAPEVVAADRVDCSKLLGGVRPKKAVQGLASALRDMRDHNGRQTPLTEEQFEAQVRDAALFLIGQRTPEQMKGNRFYSEGYGKLDLDEPVKRSIGSDPDTIKDAFYSRLKLELATLKYDGVSTAQVIKKLDAEEEVLVLTHMGKDQQAGVAKILEGYSDLKGVAPVQLVGAEYDPATADAVARAKLIHESPGGGFDFKLSAAKRLSVGGGALDVCLAQTIATAAKKTKVNEVTVQVLVPLTYLDLTGRFKDIKDARYFPLAEFLKVSDAAEIDRVMGKFNRALIRDMQEEGFKPDTYNANPGGLPTLSFKNRAGRVVKIEFRQ